ncbi:iron transporter [Photobacterium jeanii]|uniref:Iron transporter n=1 Tax=Photobacterium jeanii TaxID=858640 RepID=A0A178K3G1_9GAMM|nr:FeoA family protein [Photobacterium jeanii]OAN11264.1 iron transporter [Photobacterium jeanii]PST90784.1 ferrous iron transport protein A [Photobacterium jeanii]
MKKKLNQLAVDEQAVIIQHHAEGAIRQRLMDLGLLPQTSIKLVRYAPLGDPIQVKVGRANVSLRRAEAETVWVELIDSGKETRQ